MGCCSVWNSFSPCGRINLYFFQSIKRLLWLFNCLSITFYPSPQQLWIKSPVRALSLLSLSLYLMLSLGLSVLFAPCKRVVLYSTEGQRLWAHSSLAFLLKKPIVINWWSRTANCIMWYDPVLVFFVNYLNSNNSTFSLGTTLLERKNRQGRCSIF